MRNALRLARGTPPREQERLAEFLRSFLYRRNDMRKIATTLVGVAFLAAAALPVAYAQSRRDRDRDYDYDRTATVSELAAADRRLNLVYQRRIADARADDRSDRRGRGWYSEEQALRESERLWINFRDAECRYLTQDDLRQRNRDAYIRGCLLEQTEERTAELRDAEVMMSSR
jgi:uncharacterized protein YecT (DUF1311 family)